MPGCIMVATSGGIQTTVNCLSRVHTLAGITGYSRGLRRVCAKPVQTSFDTPPSKPVL